MLMVLLFLQTLCVKYSLVRSGVIENVKDSTYGTISVISAGDNSP